jgi:ribonuclease G
VVSAYCDEQGGFIIRTAAEGISEEDLASDAAYLKRVWTKVMERKNATRPVISCTANWRSLSAYYVTLPMRSSTEFVLTPA